MFVLTYNNRKDHRTYQREFHTEIDMLSVIKKQTDIITDTVSLRNGFVYIDNEYNVSIGSYVEDTKLDLPKFTIGKPYRRCITNEDVIYQSDEMNRVFESGMALNYDGLLVKADFVDVENKYQFILNDIEEEEYYRYYAIKCGDLIDDIKFKDADLVFEFFEDKIIYIIKDKFNIFKTNRIIMDSEISNKIQSAMAYYESDSCKFYNNYRDNYEI